MKWQNIFPFVNIGVSNKKNRFGGDFMEKKNKKKKRTWILITAGMVLAGIVAAGSIYSHFGGFGTGPCADTTEFAQYAEQVEDLKIPEKTKIVALGEASHGNAEFQQLKLSVFQNLVENAGIRAFALEGDYGGCEYVNRYIHGGEGTVEQAAAAIGFAIYRTDEMADLISYMRKYNETAKDGDDLRFYGFDMQRWSYNLQYLIEACEKAGIDVTELKKLEDTEEQHSEYDVEQQSRVTKIRCKGHCTGGSSGRYAAAEYFSWESDQFCRRRKCAQRPIDGRKCAVDPFYGRAEGQFLYFYFRSQWAYRAAWKLWRRYQSDGEYSFR